MRISDWSSDVCSSDLAAVGGPDVVEPEEGADAGGAGPPVDSGREVGHEPAHLHEVAVRRRRDAHQLMTGKRSPPMGAHDFIVEWSKFGHGEPFQQTSSGCATRIHDHRGRSVRFSPAPWMVRWVWTVMSPTSYCIGSDISRSCSSGKAVSASPSP